MIRSWRQLAQGIPDHSDKISMNKNIYGLLVLTLFACSPFGGRKIASVDPDLKDLLKASEDVLTTVESPQFDSKVCKTYLGKLESALDTLDVKSLSKNQLEANGPRIADNSWKIRTTLHSRLHDFDKECVYQIQATFRQLRFIEDYILEMTTNVDHTVPSKIDFPNEPIPMLASLPHYVTRTSDGEEVKFEDGDVLVTRGVSFLSGMIARLGTRATQFSHIVFVHEDPETKKMKTIESYVGVGVQFYEMDFALKNYNARILWLRSKDRGLGARASKEISNLVKKANASGKPIKYDYNLDFKDNKTMSCAEVSQVAYEMASNNTFRIPFYPNEISGAESLVSRLKIAKGPTYEPGDMEIDPRFKLMGEFNDLRLTRDSRQKDAVMSSIFSWMDEKQYVLHDNMTSKMAGGIVHKARKTFLWPLLRGILKVEDFSKEIPANMLSTVTLINELGEVLLAEVQKKDTEFEAAHGVPMTALHMAEVLEEYRQIDLKIYENKKTRKKAQFHALFRPKK